ncbi:Alpha/beta hydrolase family protein [Rubripirellula tenax]|uniref:Alpha/beta hydrolase family protein n=1 Tax=Rubripirellula tenax TaxID=2528015 RepID=A0A5C6ECG7_9BACT|nr:alpha/beta hydrolase [Rubripirellula tenax]TWU47483.1 Alpha/beta hydrolase family protein [Rubripirellula tenax]
MGRYIQSFRRSLLDRMVLRPSRGFVDHGSQEPVMLGAEGSNIECFVHRHPCTGESADVLAIKFPGTAGRAERSSSWPSGMLDDVSCETWTWNPPGYGQSAGRASLTGMAHAGQRFASEVLRRSGDSPKTIWLIGNSLGCNTALFVATKLSDVEIPIGLILRNPPPLVPVVKRIAKRYPGSRFVDAIAESVCDEMNAMMTAPHVRYPAVFLQSGSDDLVPPEMQNEVIEDYAGDHQLVEMEGLDHGGIASDRHDKQIRSGIQWLWQRTGVEAREWATR